MKYKDLIIPDTVLSDPLSYRLQKYKVRLYACRRTFQGQVRSLHHVLLPHIKIALIQSGECQVLIQGQSFHGRPGDLFLIPPYLLHSAQFLSEKLATCELLFQIDGLFDQEEWLTLFHHQLYFPGLANESLFSLIHYLMDKADREESGYVLGLQQLILQLTLRMLAAQPASPVLGSPDSAVLGTAEAFLKELEASGEVLSVQDYCQRLHVSQSYLCRCTRSVVQLSPQDLIIQHRLYASLKLLADPSLTLRQIADRLHYQNPAYFSRQFKAVFSLSPNEYRKTFFRTRPLSE